MKSKLSESHNLKIEGVLDITDNIITVIIEEIGERDLSDLLSKFNGSNVKISVSFGTDLE